MVCCCGNFTDRFPISTFFDHHTPQKFSASAGLKCEIFGKADEKDKTELVLIINNEEIVDVKKGEKAKNHSPERDGEKDG